MTDTTPFGFGKFVPGFDFLQNLASSAVQGAQQGLPNMPNLSSWVAPTLSVEEIEKRISELKAVQFWLDQNARALAATIQALEVQKMTLATLKGMNFSMGDVAKAFQVKTADMVAELQKASANLAAAATAASTASAPTPAPATAPEPEPAPAPEPAPEPAASQAEAPAAPGVIDPLQWWGALTQQFQQIATDAIKDTAVAQALDSTRNLATDLAREALKTTAEAVTAGVKVAKAANSAQATKTSKAASTAEAKAAAPAKSGARKAAPARKAPAAKKAAPAPRKATPRRAA
ncbi:MAG: hypothetical protein EKK45_07860 [Curvibacter sp.]|nr:MAG: hypothetical protein EKK45_07860 [Curvibacter sp.]